MVRNAFTQNEWRRLEREVQEDHSEYGYLPVFYRGKKTEAKLVIYSELCRRLDVPVVVSLRRYTYCTISFGTWTCDNKINMDRAHNRDRFLWHRFSNTAMRYSRFPYATHDRTTWSMVDVLIRNEKVAVQKGLVIIEALVNLERMKRLVGVEH